MTEEQTSRLWAFARGDIEPQAFESWFFEQEGIEAELGEELNLNLLSADYRDERDAVPQLRKRLALHLEPIRRCECPKVKDMSAIPMGGDFHFERVFEPLVTKLEFGKAKWWLYISSCSICQTHWLVAQDDLIYDDFFMRRISSDEVDEAMAGRWPETFKTHESVLSFGRTVSRPPVFFDRYAASLIWTVEDLREERPEIVASEIGYLLGLSENHAAELVSKAKDGK